MSPPTLSPATGSRSVTMEISVGTAEGKVDDASNDLVVESPINFDAALPAMKKAEPIDEPDWELGSGPLGI